MNIKFKYLIIFSLLLTCQLFSQKIEFQEYKLPTENNLQEVEFFNIYNGIIVTDSAEIFYTKNGGKDWQLSDFEIDFLPKALIFTSNGEAIIVGTKFTIIKSYDYGKNWLIINHDQKSLVNLNNVFTRSPYEVYVTQEKSNNLHYSINGLKSIKTVLLGLSNYNFGTFPMVYNKYDDNFYCSGGSSYLRQDDSFKYFSEGVFISKYFDVITPTGTSTALPLRAEGVPYSTSKSLALVDKNVVRFSGHNLFTINGYDYYRGYYNNIIELNNEGNKIYVYDDNNVVIPCNNGELILLNDFKFNDYSKAKASFEERRFKVSDTTLFDFHQIKSNKGIVTGMKGKYFIYDRSNTIDTLVVDTTNLDDYKPKDTTTFSSSNVIVYPNPSADYFTIEFLEKTNVESVQVFDVKGYRELNYVLNLELDIYKIDLRELQRGTYYLEIITSSGVFHKKIIKF